MTYTYLIPQVPSDRDHIQVGATNLAIKLQVREGNDVVNISSASALTIIIEKPDSTLVSASATLFTDGSDGMMIYRTSGSDLDQAGNYNVQGYVVITGFSGYTTPVHFTVYPNLPLADYIEDIT